MMRLSIEPDIGLWYDDCESWKRRSAWRSETEYGSTDSPNRSDGVRYRRHDWVRNCADGLYRTEYRRVEHVVHRYGSFDSTHHRCSYGVGSSHVSEPLAVALKAGSGVGLQISLHSLI